MPYGQDKTALNQKAFLPYLRKESVCRSPHFLHFMFRSMLIFLLLRQVLFTLIRVYLFSMSLTCRFF